MRTMFRFKSDTDFCHFDKCFEPVDNLFAFVDLFFDLLFQEGKIYLSALEVAFLQFWPFLEFTEAKPDFLKRSSFVFQLRIELDK